ncbi:MAG: HEPN domain-containing protein [Bacteroidales bacterium]|nr:HEPN domain-containing protein [Bacteroidales bacterium]
MFNNQEKKEIVRYRIEHAVQTLSEVEVLLQNRFYNTAANRMYYACYYAVSALLVANGIVAKSHDGAKQMFGMHFRGPLKITLRTILNLFQEDFVFLWNEHSYAM